ncbi:LA_3751/LA_3752 family putative glycosyltransferase [Aphanothece sacrum]|nr:dolichol-phosphate mannosyltransferase [Aphanothece sacrum]
MKIGNNGIPWGIIFAGMLFSLYLVWQIPNGVYFSGDGGLKALLAQQLSAGVFHFDLVKPSEIWIQKLWSEGLYAYQEPFVYYLNNRYFITFPFPFSLVTAPFYALFGYRGLYIVPLVATWVIWGTFYGMCQRFKLNLFNTSLALFILIFASNLTLYSAMYWEHTLAVALCFAGMAILFSPTETGNLSSKNVILSGCLIGFSAWVRSEFFAMVATLTFLGCLLTILNHNYFQNIREKIKLNQSYFSVQKLIFFLISLFTTVGLFFLSNQLIYGHFLGIHALQIVEGFTLARRLKEAWESLQEISLTFFEYFPIAIFPLLYIFLNLLKKATNKVGVGLVIIGLLFLISLQGVTLVLNWKTNDLSAIKNWVKQWGILLFICASWLYLLRKVDVKVTPRMILIYGICILFTVGVALLVDSGSDEIAVGGKQWGQRYLLILLPFVSLMGVQQLNVIKENSPSIPHNISLFFVGILLIISCHKNLYEGTVFFQKAHEGVAPAIEALQKNSNRIIVVSHQYAAQVLESPLRKNKIFFRIENSQNLVKLGNALVENNQSSFIYVCYPHRECKLPQESPENWKFAVEGQNFQIKMLSLGKIGKYPMYEVAIKPIRI